MVGKSKMRFYDICMYMCTLGIIEYIIKFLEIFGTDKTHQLEVVIDNRGPV